MTHVPPDAEQPAFLARMNQLAAEVDETGDVYAAGLRLWEVSGRAVDAGELAGNFCALWGALTDWIELKPDEADQAEAAMRRAAREWLGLDQTDSGAIQRYLDHWLHDICGYERP
ncbi:hypothetical protein [Micromonospora sp. NPDC005707]|uniref:hypothetical protein n=1 Tax=Micromonospora sp. NPDC005707 TaxID=3157050 RepID=UPI0033F77A1E